MKPSFDEMQAGAGAVRPHYSGFDRWQGGRWVGVDG